MTQSSLVEQAKQGNENAIASLMNRLLKSQGMLANVERNGDHLEILIESDLRSLDDEMRIPKRQVLVGMLKKWFVTLEVKTVSSIKISWQQTGFDEPAWTEEVSLIDQNDQLNPKELNPNITENSGIDELPRQPKIMPLPVFPPKTMRNDEPTNPSGDRTNISNQSTTKPPDLDEMFGEVSSLEPLPNIAPNPEKIPDIANISTSSGSEILMLSDVPVIPDTEEIRDFQSEQPISVNPLSWQTLFTTPSFIIQLVQYLVVCGIIILTLRTIHTVFGGSKAPKAASVTTQIILR